MNLYRVCFHIGTNQEMPEEWLGAYVTIFASGTDHELTLKSMVNDMVSKGYKIKGIEGKIDQLDPHKWDSFIKDAWADFPDFYPTQNEVLAAMSNDGLLLYSPFAGYDSQ